MLSVRRSNAPTCGRCDEHANCGPNGECSCNVGWSGDGLVSGQLQLMIGGTISVCLQSCTDVNECLMVGICGTDAMCRNLPGSYVCECAQGFLATSNGCVDLDECAEGLVTCPSGDAAECHNTRGSFEFGVLSISRLLDFVDADVVKAGQDRPTRQPVAWVCCMRINKSQYSILQMLMSVKSLSGTVLTELSVVSCLFCCL